MVTSTLANRYTGHGVSRNIWQNVIDRVVSGTGGYGTVRPIKSWIQLSNLGDRHETRILFFLPKLVYGSRTKVYHPIIQNSEYTVIQITKGWDAVAEYRAECVIQN